MEPLKPHDVDLARRVIAQNHPLSKISLFKALPFLEILTCRRCNRQEEQEYVKEDEYKLLKFQKLKHLETIEQRDTVQKADQIKNMLFNVAGDDLDELEQIDPQAAQEIRNEQSRIQEEDKEREIGTFLTRNTQRRNLESEFPDDSDSNQNDVLNSPMLKETPFLYLGFGINLYFNFLTFLMLTLGVI